MGGRRTIAAMAAACAVAAAIAWQCLLPREVQEEQAPAPGAPAHAGSVTSLHSPQTAQQIAAMLGAHVRLVWLRARDWREVRRSGERTHIDTGRFTVTLATPSRDPDLLEPAARADGGGKDADLPGIGRWIDRRGAFAIMALDSDDGQERELVPTARLYNPLIMPDGGQVVFSCDDPATGAWSISSIGWDGTGRRVLGPGYALWTWSDPASGEAWIYGCDRLEAAQGVWRMRPGQPLARQAVYAGAASQWFSLSHDGRRAAGGFPWPVVGMLELPGGMLDTRGFRDGCNAYIAPDDSYRISVLNGAHNAVTIYQPGQPEVETSLIPPLMKRTVRGGPGKMWNPKWAGDARHVLVCGPNRPTTIDAAEVWLGAYAGDYRSIRQWIQVTHSDCYDACAQLWRDPGLGERRGPAPLTIALPGLEAGSWTIDFGDGGPVGAAAAVHTYDRPGVYAISARRGAELRTGRVTVEARQPPLPTAAYRRGLHEVEIRCAQALTSAGLTVRSPTGVPAAQLAVAGDGRRIFCAFAEAIHLPCVLALGGLHGQQQEAGAGAAATVAVRAEPWPADPADLAFAWANAQRDNSWYCAGRFTASTMVRHGAARIDRDGALLLAGGSYEARLDDGVSPWPGRDQGGRRAALTLELTIRLRAGAAAACSDLITLGPPPPGGSALALERAGAEIRLVAGGRRLAIGRIADGARHQLAVSLPRWRGRRLPRWRARRGARRTRRRAARG